MLDHIHDLIHLIFFYHNTDLLLRKKLHLIIFIYLILTSTLFHATAKHLHNRHSPDTGFAERGFQTGKFCKACDNLNPA